MIGIIVTGHGKFAPGIMDVVELIVGEQANCEVVEFVPTDSIEQLTDKMATAWERLDTGCDGVLVFCDLPGGSPFNVAIRLKLQRQKPAEVLAGVNVPMLSTAAMSRDSVSSLDELVEEVLEAGKENIFAFDPPPLTDDDEWEEE